VTEPTPPDAPFSVGSGPLHEAIRRGVQYLAFRFTEAGLVATYQPGAMTAPVLVTRAALVAVAADAALAAFAETDLAPLARRARRAREALAEQLKQVRERRPEALRILWRERYLAALAELMIGQMLPAARRASRS
jgi:hypothetical protein